MQQADIIQYVNESDLTGTMKDVCDIIGIEKFRELVKIIGGESSYFPAFKNYKPAILRFIKENWGSMNNYEMAKAIKRHFNFTTQTAAKLVKEVREQKGSLTCGNV